MVVPCGIVFKENPSDWNDVQSWTVRQAGNHKDVIACTSHQQFMDQACVYYVQADCHPVFMFIDRAPNSNDYSEKVNNYRIKFLVLQGRDNDYERLEYCLHNKSRKEYEELKKKLSDERIATIRKTFEDEKVWETFQEKLQPG